MCIFLHIKFIHSFSFTVPLFSRAIWKPVIASTMRGVVLPHWLWRDINMSSQVEARDIWLELSGTGTRGQVSVIQLSLHILTMLKKTRMTPKKGAFMCALWFIYPNSALKIMKWRRNPKSLYLMKVDPAGCTKAPWIL